MNHQALIDATASEADTFLAGISSMTEARAAILDHLKTRFPKLSPSDHPLIVAGVLAILQEEGFFEGTAGADLNDASEPGGGSDDDF